MAKKAAKKAIKKAVSKKVKKIEVWYTIPPELKQEADKFIADLVFNYDERNLKILEVLKTGNKEGKTISKLHWELRSLHGINRRPESLKKIAIKHKIPYTE